MTGGDAGGRGVGPALGHRSLRQAWERRDPGLRATKRAVRAAVVIPGVFALAQFGVRNAETTLFSVFGSFALLLFADFGGPPRIRLRSYLGLFAAGVLLITVGTLCSSPADAAVVGMAVFGFLILFAGVVSPQAAAAATAALLTFVLPVAVPAGASAIGSRLAGWALAGVFCIPAVMLVWSERWHDPLRRKAADAAGAVAELVDAHAQGRFEPGVRRRAGDAVGRLRDQYEATPYRPAGAGPTDTALVRLVSRLEWVGENALVPSEARDLLVGDPLIRRVHERAARVLRGTAAVLESEDDRSLDRDVDALRADIVELSSVKGELTGAAWQRLLAASGEPVGSTTGDGGTADDRLLWRLDSTYPVRILASATEMTADMAVASVRGSDALGPITGVRAWVWAMAAAASARLTLRSVWFRNSLRGAAAMAAAVAVVEAINVRHGFWVVLGTLSVLRSNAVGTGATALRAVAGTAAGVAVGAVVLALLGPHLTLLWLVLPFAVLVAGVAPSAISFTSGQAGFTVAVVIIFNILEPVGSKVGLVRFEDVAIGVAVSTVIGLLFWPRGASTELARILCEAYGAALSWLAAEVIRFDGDEGRSDDPAPASRASDAALRLDDAFRQFMSERGAKQVPLPTVTHLVTGCARVRLVALTLASAPHPEAPQGAVTPGSVAEVRRDVAAALVAVEQWYEASAVSLTRRPAVLPPVASVDGAVRSELLVALERALSERTPDRAMQAIRLIWVVDHLGALEALQVELSESADRFAPG